MIADFVLGFAHVRLQANHAVVLQRFPDFRLEQRVFDWWANEVDVQLKITRVCDLGPCATITRQVPKHEDNAESNTTHNQDANAYYQQDQVDIGFRIVGVHEAI